MRLTARFETSGEYWILLFQKLKDLKNLLRKVKYFNKKTNLISQDEHLPHSERQHEIWHIDVFRHVWGVESEQVFDLEIHHFIRRETLETLKTTAFNKNIRNRRARKRVWDSKHILWFLTSLFYVYHPVSLPYSISISSIILLFN